MAISLGVRKLIRKHGIETRCKKWKYKMRYWGWGGKRKCGITKTGNGADLIQCNGTEVNIKTVSGAEWSYPMSKLTYKCILRLSYNDPIQKLAETDSKSI